MGLVIREKVDEVPEELRSGRTVREVMSKDAEGSLRVLTDAPLESLLLWLFPSIGPHGLLLGPVSRYRQDPIVQGNLNILRVDAGHVQEQLKAIGIFAHIDRWTPLRRRTAAVGVANRPV